MADSEINLKILADLKQATAAITTFGGKAQESLGGIEKSFDSIKTLAQGAIGFLAGREILRAFDSITKASSESEQAITRMEVALKLSGGFSEAASKGFQQFATQLQNTSTFSDEAALKAVALAKSFNTTNDQAKKLVTAGADLAAALGIGLDEAVSQLGKTLDGTPGRIKEVIPGLRNFTAAQFEAGAAIDYVSSRFKGAALADAQTYSGSIIRLKNTFDDVLETLGGFVTKNTFVLDAISKAQELFKDLNGVIEKNKEAIFGLVKDGVLFLIKGFSGLLTVIKIVDIVFQTIYASVGAVVGLLAILPEKLKALANLDFKKALAIDESYFDEVKKSFSDVNSRGNIYDGLKDSVDKYAASLEKTSAKQVESFKKASDSVENTKKQIDELNKATRESFIGQVQANPVAGLFNNERFGIATPLGGNQRERNVGIIAGAAQALQKGAAGAAQLFSQGVAAVADNIVPGFGKAFAQVFELLSQNPDVLKAQIDAFTKAIPDIIANIVQNIPYIAEKFSEYVTFRFATDLIKNLPRIISGFAQEFLKIPQEFLKALLDGLKDGLKGVIDALNPAKIAGSVGGPAGQVAGGGLGSLVGGIVGGPIGAIAGAIGGVFGFAEGGKVPAGFPNDSFPARLTSGEVILPPSPSAKLERFLNNQDRNQGQDSSQTRALIDALNRSSNQNLTLKLQVGEKELANVLLNIGRRGFRTA